MTPRPLPSAYGYWVSPAAEIAAKTERLEVSSRIAADFVGYYGGAEVDRKFTNIFVPLSAQYRTEKDVLGFTGGFTRDNTLLSELQATGVALDFTQRNQWAANPTWMRRLTEKLSVQMGGQFSYTTYEGGDNSRLVDYRLVGSSGGVLYQLTERDQIQLTGSYTDFQTLNSKVSIRATFPGVVISLSHLFSESLKGTVYGGPKFVSAATEVNNSSVSATQTTVWVAGGSITQQFERAVIQASIARDLAPSGFGLLIETNRAEVTGSYKLTETVTCTLNVVGALTSGKTEMANGIPFPDRRYISVRPAMAWKFHEWWEAEVSYMYRWQEFDLPSTSVLNVLTTAQSQGATFMVTYSPPKISFSH
ncbi:MAG: hypothetical protein HOO98_04660 [Nitrospira sp.]|nr:hypothetical protein [Nitrospira sp.]